ncbi:type II and III secretion system protein family protein [Terasakiella sp. A23]|uniref:type II and III secretion system protein family protein n=1 Tax=Terasakiella sp. FCG-A23 TaxID=3080561 RepID=UPI002955CFE9|nr:type II and III secretion system protein family protein [Terasakiella sp. A23]MDV7340376.1 type II and III secretion system protein family protein [Terasakiella sp. A23]
MLTFIEKLQKLTLVLTIAVFTAVGAGTAYGVEILPSAQTSLSVELNKSRLIRLSRAATSVFIANPEVADVQVKSPTLVYLFGKNVGTTTLYAVDGEDRVLANMDVNVTHNLKNLHKAVMHAVPDADVQFSSINGTLVMDGVINSAREMEDINQIAKRFSPSETGVINRLRVDALNQVNLRVRIAEVSRDIDKRLGFNWNMVGSIGSAFSFGLVGSNSFAQGLSTLSVTTNDISGVLDAMEDEGLVTILSEPNLTAMSGEEASFLAGGEFPILVPSDDGPSIDFREYGVRLSFKPVVMDDGRINLQVEPEVSSLSETSSVTLDGYVIPSLTTRKTKTTVELGSGQSFAIAGLLQNKTGHNLSKFPGLGDIPILGSLFRSDSFQREESELVIIITPYLVKPITHAKASLPTDGYSAPHDIERIFVGGANRRNPQVGNGLHVDKKGRKLIGPVGFALN